MIGELCALGAALSWALASVLLKRLSHLNPVMLNGLRCSISALFFALILFPTGRASLLADLSPWALGGLIGGSVIGVAVGESLFILSLRYIDVSQAYPISICGSPLVTVLLAVAFLGERVTGYTLLGAGLVLVGIYLVAFPRENPRFALFSPRQRRGLLLVLLTVLCWGVGVVLIRVGLGEGDIVVANFVRLGGAGLLMLLATPRHWRSLDPRRSGLPTLSLAVLSGLLGFALGGIVWLMALQYAGVAKTSILSSTSPLFLVPLAVLFFKESVTIRLGVGVVLSVVGIGLVVA